MVERLERVAEGVRERLRKAQAGRPVLLLYEDAAIHLRLGRLTADQVLSRYCTAHGQEQIDPQSAARLRRS